MKDLQYFDVLRADRCTASHGLELRVPFLDQEFMTFCHTIPGILRKPTHNIEKYYLRSCFEDMLPYDIVWRKKEALSDGISGLEKSWFEYIQEWVREYFSHNLTREQFIGLQNIASTCNMEYFLSEESLYYYQQFSRFYKHRSIPYYWLPKWQVTNEPSARTLSVFQSDLKDDNL